MRRQCLTIVVTLFKQIVGCLIDFLFNYLNAIAEYDEDTVSRDLVEVSVCSDGHARIFEKI